MPLGFVLRGGFSGADGDKGRDSGASHRGSRGPETAKVLTHFVSSLFSDFGLFSGFA